MLNHKELVCLFTVTTDRKQRALLMTSCAAWLRASEVTRLKITDIDRGRMCIRVEQGKGAKDRYVRLSPHLLVHLRDYWRRCPTPIWLFPGHPDDRPLSRHGAAHICATAKAKAGITKQGGIHTLGHCFASHLLEAGTELPVLQRLMGHGSIRSTMRYLQMGPLVT